MAEAELLAEIRELKQLFEDEIMAYGPFSFGNDSGATESDTGAEKKAEPESSSMPTSEAAETPKAVAREESARVVVESEQRQPQERKPKATSMDTGKDSRTITIEDKLPADSILRSMSTLEEVEKYVAGTVLIPLDESRTNPVFGVGNPEAELMVVGEAPGADEDEQGEPFVGRAGQLLNKILASIDFDRNEVYIANILKSRPPKNRNPLPEEIEKHIPVLHKQIALVRPRMILCVGKVAANTLLENNSSLGSMRQKLHDLCGVPVVVTYHPAALLRNPNWKKPTWEDVKFLRAQFDEIGAEASV